jgi:CRISPR system Cascade subunit CasD
MTAVLKLCFDAPMQSWGTRSHGIIRDTAMEPTKSGVLGLLAAAMGIDRTDDAVLAELAQLKMAIRVDREGILQRDFQTAQNVPTTSGTGHRTVISERYYLADALFLVLIIGDDAIVVRLVEALRKPRWPLCFGRRAFVPSRPVLVESDVRDSRPIHEVLASEPWLEISEDVMKAEMAKPATTRFGLRSVIDCDPSTPEGELRHDHPISFAPERRRFTSRSVVIGQIPLTDEMINLEKTGVPE